MKKYIEQIKENYKENKLTYITAITIFIIGLFILYFIVNNNTKIYSNDKISIKYDKNWKLISKKNDLITLRHKKIGTMNIESVELTEDLKYSDMNGIIDEILFNIGIHNKNYNLISKKTSSITKNKYEGYKILYENKDNQVLVALGKLGNKILIVTYEADTNYFDILLNSAENIINNISFNPPKFKIKNYVDLSNDKIKLSKNKELDKYNKMKEETIANANYYVKFQIPKEFKYNSFNTDFYDGDLQGLKHGKINLNVKILRRNIYEYIDKNDKYSSLNLIYEDLKKDKTSKFKDIFTIEEINNKKIYIYKTNYQKQIFNAVEKYEVIHAIFELDKNHIVEFKITSLDNLISERFLEKINIKSAKKISSYITSTIENDKKIATLKNIYELSTYKYHELKLKLPKKYKELDKYNNQYKERYYGYNFDEINELYQYNIKYELTENYTNIDNILERINSQIYSKNGNYNKLQLKYEKNINNVPYSVYEGGYEKKGPGYDKNSKELSHYVYKTVLISKLENKGYLVIDILSNDNKISDEVLNDLTNIDIIK